MIVEAAAGGLVAVEAVDAIVVAMAAAAGVVAMVVVAAVAGARNQLVLYRRLTRITEKGRDGSRGLCSF